MASAKRPSAASRWIDARLNDAASALAGWTDALVRRRTLVYAERPDGAFAREGEAPLTLSEGVFAQPTRWRGGEVEFHVSPARCVFRDLELPARAADFLDGVVRAQIDRITPWRAEDAAFGCAPPSPRPGERIAVEVAAARRAPLAELADAAGAAGADAVTISVQRTPGGPFVALLTRRSGASRRLGGWRFALIALLFVAMAAGLAALAAQATLGGGLDAEIASLSADLAQRRAVLLRRERAGTDPAAQALEKDKRAAVAAVVVLEALSRALPDEAYLSEMRLEGDRLEIAGVAQDAAKLVSALETSPQFAEATFSAPTTRVEGKGETFRIAARVRAAAEAAR